MTRVYCNKTAEDRIMQFSLQCNPMLKLFACQVWLQNSGSNWSGWGGFWSSLRRYISETVRHKAQVTINHTGSHMWAFDCNKSWWPWMTLNINLLLCRQSRRGACFFGGGARFDLAAPVLPRYTNFTFTVSPWQGRRYGFECGDFRSLHSRTKLRTPTFCIRGGHKT